MKQKEKFRENSQNPLALAGGYFNGGYKWEIRHNEDLVCGVKVVTKITGTGMKTKASSSLELY